VFHPRRHPAAHYIAIRIMESADRAVAARAHAC
jgi:hypothetical protein